MKKLMALVALTGALLVAGAGNAAPVDVTLTQTGALTWDLTVSTSDAVGIAGVAVNIANVGLAASGTPSFVIAQTNAIIDPFVINGGFSFQLQTAGNLRMSIGPGTQGYMLAGPGSLLIGTFTAGSGGVTLLAADPLDGVTVLADDFETGLPFTLHTVPLPVPEPTAVLLIGIGMAGLSVVRRRSA